MGGSFAGSGRRVGGPAPIGRAAVQCRTGTATAPDASAGGGRIGPGRYAGPAMSTRKLILAALLCGMAILVAFTVQVLMLSGSS